jgi:hypothetical protein
VPDLNKSFVEEAREATRGVLALIVGDRGASRYFSFTQLGLVSSFIAVLAVTIVELVVLAALGAGGIFSAAVQTALIYGAVIGASWLYLRQIGRPDAMIPFVVTINWANAVLTVVMLATTLLGLSFLQLILLVAGVVLSINIARLVMTLRAMQIVLLIVVQAVGLVAALLLIVVLFPPTPEQLAQITAAASSRP